MSLYDGKPELCVDCGCWVAPGMFDFYPDGIPRCNDKVLCAELRKVRSGVATDAPVTVIDLTEEV